MMAPALIILFATFWNLSTAQVQEICSYMKSNDTLVIQSDSTVLVPNRDAVFRIPTGWTGTVDFDDLGTISLTKTYSDSAKIIIIASEAWLVEFHDEFVQRQISYSEEHCEFELRDYVFAVYKLENEPITLFYQVARTEKDKDGWTWFFRLVANSDLTDIMKSEVKSIISQIVNIYDPGK